MIDDFSYLIHDFKYNSQNMGSCLKMTNLRIFSFTKYWLKSKFIMKSMNITLNFDLRHWNSKYISQKMERNLA
jgi:hypothetical protein